MNTDNSKIGTTNSDKIHTGSTHVTHEFGPIFDEQSQLLILGSFPSVKSREQQFYYGHPQNRFWKLLAALTDEEIPESIEQKKTLLHTHHIALWDVIAECDIVGSSDSSIRNVIPNNLDIIIGQAPIRSIIANGTKSYELLIKYNKDRHNIVKLPSTSPANAAWNLEKLTEAWRPYF